MLLSEYIPKRYSPMCLVMLDGRGGGDGCSSTLKVEAGGWSQPWSMTLSGRARKAVLRVQGLDVVVCMGLLKVE
jgi:hypothetical protein